MTFELDLKPASFVTAGYIGEPGERTFYIQAEHDGTLYTLLCEKQQVQSLAIGIERFIKSLHQKYPQLPDTIIDYDAEDLNLRQPIEPIFRVGDIGLGYDEDSDLLVLVISEMLANEETGEVEPGSVVRVWAQRDEMMALSRHGTMMVKQGRPQFVERRNGHKH